MDTLTFKIVELVITIAVLVICRYVTPVLKEKAENEKAYEIMRWATEFVFAAEQVFGSKTGEQKKQYVTELLTNLCDKKNIGITEDQISALIESAVYMMKQENK